jgi:hypothetical protein
MQNAREITPEQAQWALAGITLRDGISSYETEPAAVDSLEEARYIEPVPEEAVISPAPREAKAMVADSVAPAHVPDTLAAPDSTSAKPPG